VEIFAKNGNMKNCKKSDLNKRAADYVRQNLARYFQSRPRSPLEKLSPTKRSRSDEIYHALKTMRIEAAKNERSQAKDCVFSGAFSEPIGGIHFAQGLCVTVVI
jgi:hypothetical protein